MRKLRWRRARPTSRRRDPLALSSVAFISPAPAPWQWTRNPFVPQAGHGFFLMNDSEIWTGPLYGSWVSDLDCQKFTRPSAELGVSLAQAGTTGVKRQHALCKL